MTRYKFRTECMDDFDRLFILLPVTAVRTVSINKPYGKNLPDREITIETKTPIEEIRSIMNSTVDGHVMAQTLKLENEYDGERDYNGDDNDSIQICPNCLIAHESNHEVCPRCSQGFNLEDSHVLKPLVQRRKAELKPTRYQDSNADQILTALNFLRANELDNVTLHHDNPDFDGPNNIVTVSGHWTKYLDRDFTGETLLESLEKAVKAKQRATV